MYKDDINLQDFFSLYNLFSTKRMWKSNGPFYPDFINSMGIQKSYSCFIILFLDSGDVVNMDLSNLHLQDDSLGKYNQKKFKSFFFRLFRWFSRTIQNKWRCVFFHNHINLILFLIDFQNVLTPSPVSLDICE